MRARRHIWSLVVGSLGLNCWVSFLLIPLLLERQLRDPLVLSLATVPVLPLCLGSWYMRPALLLGVYPATLLLPVLVEPSLVGSSIYSGMAFPFVLVAMTAYTAVALYVLGLAIPDGQPVAPTRVQPVVGSHADLRQWRRRGRVAGYFAVLSLLFPLVATTALFLHHDAAAAWRGAFPQRAAAAAVFFALLMVLLWVALHKLLISRALDLHLRADPQLHASLQRLRSSRPMAPAWVYLSALAAVTAGLVLAFGR